MSEQSSIATNESISFYPKHITILNNIAKKHNIKTKSATVQYIVETYYKAQINIKRDVFIHIGIPIAFIIFSYYTFLNLQKLEDMLFLKDLYFYELSILKDIFFIITLAIIFGVFVPSIYFLYHKRKQQE